MNAGIGVTSTARLCTIKFYNRIIDSKWKIECSGSWWAGGIVFKGCGVEWTTCVKVFFLHNSRQPSIRNSSNKPITSELLVQFWKNAKNALDVGELEECLTERCIGLCRSNKFHANHIINSLSSPTDIINRTTIMYSNAADSMMFRKNCTVTTVF